MKKIGNLVSLSVFFFSFLTSYFGFGSNAAWAQQGTVVTSTVDKNRVEVGDTFTLTVTVQYSENVEIDEPQLPRILGLELVQRWDNTSVQQSLVQTSSGMDFKTIRKREFHYAFQTRSVGPVSVDAFEIVVSGKLFKTEPISVEVLPEGQAPSRNQGGARNARPGGVPDEDLDPEEEFLRQQEEIFNQLLQRQLGGGGGFGRGLPVPQPQANPGFRPIPNPDFRSMPTNPNDAFFIQVEVDKLSVFEGEQVTVSWYLLTRGQMETLDRVKFPSLKGFWKEIIEENPQITFSEEIINGVPYRKALLASHALFPIKAGKAVIDEFTVKSRVRTPSRNFGFGLGRAFEYTKSSKRVEIQVKPLPVGSERPSSFTGAVGSYEVTAQIDGNQIPVNQPFSYKIRFEGQGNAKAIELPAIEWPAGIEMYDSKNESRFFKDGNSFKQFEVLLIPRKEGPMEIPGVQFSFFNPKTGKYEQRSTQPVKMTFLPPKEGSPAASNTFLGDASGVQKQKTLALPDLIPTVAIGSGKGSFAAAFSSGAASAQAPGVWGIFGIGFLAAILALAGLGYQELKPKSKSVSLRKKLDQAWKKVEKALAQSQMKQVGIEVVNSFNLVLAEVTSHKGETQEITKMLEKLDPEKRTQYGEKLMKLYEEAQLLGFAPESAIGHLAQPEKVKSLATQSKQILNHLCDL